MSATSKILHYNWKELLKTTLFPKRKTYVILCKLLGILIRSQIEMYPTFYFPAIVIWGNIIVLEIFPKSLHFYPHQFHLFYNIFKHVLVILRLMTIIVQCYPKYDFFSGVDNFMGYSNLYTKISESEKFLYNHLKAELGKIQEDQFYILCIVT